MFKSTITNLFRTLLIASFIALSTACVIPGHRQQLVEEDIQLRTELTVKEDKLYELVIRSIDNKVKYQYKFEGKDAVFDKQAQEWIAKYVQMIAEAVTADLAEFGTFISARASFH